MSLVELTRVREEVEESIAHARADVRKLRRVTQLEQQLLAELQDLTVHCPDAPVGSVGLARATCPNRSHR